MAVHKGLCFCTSRVVHPVFDVSYSCSSRVIGLFGTTSRALQGVHLLLLDTNSTEDVTTARFLRLPRFTTVNV
jgi:hypothetical protein